MKTYSIFSQNDNASFNIFAINMNHAFSVLESRIKEKLYKDRANQKVAKARSDCYTIKLKII